MLIATLPSIYRTELLETIMAHPMINGVRYNTGAKSPYSPHETLAHLDCMAQKYNKTLWVDLKGRQLRITKWTGSEYGIYLNHSVKVQFPAKVHFRGGDWATLKKARKNVIFVDPPPEFAGAGQAINIVGPSVDVQGYLTRRDIAYIEAAKRLGIYNFMLSFVESMDDITEVENIMQLGIESEVLNLVLKIETKKGIEFVKKQKDVFWGFENIYLMAATDDLSMDYAGAEVMLPNAMGAIIKADPKAIFASNIFNSLRSSENLSLPDVLSLKKTWEMGYKNFLFQDEICWQCFDKVIEYWKDFLIMFGGD
jgi:pyruvate kinase